MADRGDADPEKRTPPLANNLLWYLVALALGTLLRRQPPQQVARRDRLP